MQNGGKKKNFAPSILYPPLCPEEGSGGTRARQKISKIYVEVSLVFSRLGFIRSEGRIYMGPGVIYWFRWHTRYRYTRISIRPLLGEEGSRKGGTWMYIVYILYAGVDERSLCLYNIRELVRYCMPLLHLFLSVSRKRYIFNIPAIQCLISYFFLIRGDQGLVRAEATRTERLRATRGYAQPEATRTSRLCAPRGYARTFLY